MFARAWDIKQRPKNIGETGIWVTGTRLFYVYIKKHRLFAASKMKRWWEQLSVMKTILRSTIQSIMLPKLPEKLGNFNQLQK